MNILKCPVCAGALELHEKILRCENNHCFDMAKEGYVNLLSARKSGDNTGDNKDMAKSRRDFLNKGYYQPLAQAVCDCIQHYSDDGGSVLDICCGEGYYTAYCAERLQRDFYGFDLSKNMVRLAAKRNCGARFFVANIASIPVRDGAVQAAFHLFAPFHAPEFRRILSDNGVIMTAIPGRNHPFGLKQVLYDAPYYNDEKDVILGKGTPLNIPVKDAKYKGKLSRKDPRLSPIYADLSGLPPMLIQAGGNELFLTESVRLAEKAAADGTTVTLTVYPGMSHDFALLLPEMQDSIDSLKEIADFANRYMK